VTDEEIGRIAVEIMRAMRRRQPPDERRQDIPSQLHELPRPDEDRVIAEIQRRYGVR
jgi:hypothetical protein